MPKLPPSALRLARIRALQAAGRRPPTPAAGPGSLADVALQLKAARELDALRGAGKLRPAFRVQGKTYPSGAIHDLNAVPEALWDDPGLVAGFVDDAGKFMSRAEAEARPALGGGGGGHSNLWLRARAEALRRHARSGRSLEQLVAEAEQKGGFTYGVGTGEQPTRGFAFSASPENEAQLPALTAKALEDYIRAHRAALNEPNAYLGAWRSPEGRWYLDVSRVLPDRAEAEALARAAKQRSIYDLSLGETLDLP